MTIGIIILAHEHLNRTRQVARAMASKDCKIVIHVDAQANKDEFEELQHFFRNNRHVAFVERLSCEWGRFSLVKAGLNAAQTMLDRWPGITHIVQISGSCLPLKPAPQLCQFLKKHPGTDFAESVPATGGAWVQDGLSDERFSLYFPFSWKRQRLLFDLSVEIQRKLRISRTPPLGLDPHLGSQWWCLSKRTLRAILEDPDRCSIDRYFSRCWIPDEGYIPTLVRKHSRKLVEKSLTLSRFDDQGKPHLFYDDHKAVLEQADFFFARKVWHGADQLYRRFTGKQKPVNARNFKTDLGLDVLFQNALRRRCEGREGRLNIGRFPAAAHNRQPATSNSYSVFFGFTHVCDAFEEWVQQTTGRRTHGRLYKANEVQFANASELEDGAVPNNPKIRDINPEQFLCNIVWNSRPDQIALMYDFADGKRMAQFFANDPKSKIIGLKGSWIIDLYQRNLTDKHKMLQIARKLSQFEADFMSELAAAGHQDHHLVTLHNLIDDFDGVCSGIQAHISPNVDLRPQGVPQRRNLVGLKEFVDQLAINGIDISPLGELPKILPGELGWVEDNRIFAVL